MPTAQRIGTVACLARLADATGIALAHALDARAVMGALARAELHVALDATPAGCAYALAGLLVACAVCAAAASVVAREYRAIGPTEA